MHLVFSTFCSDRVCTCDPFLSLAGDAYTIADMSCLPWVVASSVSGMSIYDYPHLAKWTTQLLARPEVQKGIDSPPTQYPPFKENKVRMSCTQKRCFICSNRAKAHCQIQKCGCGRSLHRPGLPEATFFCPEPQERDA